MVVLSDPALHQIPLVKSAKLAAGSISVVDLSKPRAAAAAAIIEACEDSGFFKVVNHGIPLELVRRLEAEAAAFFARPPADKESAIGPADPFGYGHQTIGGNGDVGWVEYLLFAVSATPAVPISSLGEYLVAVKRLAGEILELVAEGLRMKQRDRLSKMVTMEESDGIFRLNHYPPCPLLLEGFNGGGLTGFGEHTDPQIMSVLRSDGASGLQVAGKDGSWIAVPPDRRALFVNVGDAMQVLTNRRFKSMRHRVVVTKNTERSRLSMIYCFGPAEDTRITAMEEIMAEGEEQRYNEFTWGEYKKAAYKTRLGDNQELKQFEK
ncbi:gibberellin 2-beta-dioxygenase 3-like [Curcuma longa]|uniref:gibberellin 2-beta-dioxygenase 3-like n=1 Tax=Curcuma longa TaxID=136217 RepID=UPI003D9F78F6